MKKIVIIGASYFQNPLILKAKEMGFETHVFAWKDGSIGEKTADFFYPISITEKEEILEVCKKINPEAVVSIASDLANITVNYICRKLGLITNSENSLLISTNKFAMRTALKQNNIPTPRFYEIENCNDLNNNLNISFPVIVKPTDRSGSRGITKLNSYDGIERAVTEAIDNSFERKAIIEEYIEGMEYSCECISYDGEHTFLAITQKFTSGSPHFIETGHIEPSNLSVDMIKKVKTTIFDALDALEIKYGASHSEFKIDSKGNIRIIEIGSRMGGDCIGSDLVPISTGYDFLKMIIQVACGQKPDMKRVSVPKVAAIKFIFDKKDISNFEMIKERFPDSIYYCSDFSYDPNSKIVDSSSRYGYYILVCDSRQEAIELGGF